MGSGIGLRNPVITSHFHHSLSVQEKALLGALMLLAAVLLAIWLGHKLLREGRHGKQDSRQRSSPQNGGHGRESRPEARARRLLRIGFGLLWILDGILQMQSGMPLRLTGQVIGEAGEGSPAWLQDAMRWGATIWNNHPVTAATAAVWIQIGIGLWLLLVVRGRWSRLGGLISVGWALSVWVLGEAMGGILAPGASWMIGAPGAVIFYAAAGALIALPEPSWRDRRLGRGVLACSGALLLAMAALQALPGNGFWKGSGGALQSMVSEMATTPQPHALSALLGDFARFAAANAVLVNLFVIAALAITGGAFLSGRVRLIRPALVVIGVLCLADWVLVQDLGVLGGMGTDPNSAIPQLLLFLAGYLALAHPPAPLPETNVRRFSPFELRPLARILAIGAALSMTALGSVSFALAAVNPNATTLLAQSIDGPTSSVGGFYRPPGFRLIDQRGQPVSLSGLRGKVVLFTFLDPVCNVDCPLIAQEFKQADQMLGSNARRVELVAINANPLYRAPSVLRAFDHQEQLERLPNWLYLTGRAQALRRVWNSFGVEVSVPSGGAMVDHAEEAAILNPRGQLRWDTSFDPGPGTSSTRSSFAVTLANAASQVLGESRS